jgi:hypothetical protein
MLLTAERTAAFHRYVSLWQLAKPTIAALEWAEVIDFTTARFRQTEVGLLLFVAWDYTP